MQDVIIQDEFNFFSEFTWIFSSSPRCHILFQIVEYISDDHSTTLEYQHKRWLPSINMEIQTQSSSIENPANYVIVENCISFNL